MVLVVDINWIITFYICNKIFIFII